MEEELFRGGNRQLFNGDGVKCFDVVKALMKAFELLNVSPKEAMEYKDAKIEIGLIAEYIVEALTGKKIKL